MSAKFRRHCISVWSIVYIVTTDHCPFDYRGLKGIVNLYFTKFAAICLSPSISPSNQHINGCFILTENWYTLPMVFFSIIRDSEQNDQISHFKVFGSKSMPKHMLIFILVKKYLKYTLHALNIPMTSKHDTMTIFTPLCM